MRKFFFGLLVLLSVVGGAQQRFNNEWIDYAKTYYKFKVGSNGVYRLSAVTLSAAGLGTADAAQFQLWRNGVQVPIYTSKASGAFNNTDYIEFWGQMNDGGPDKELYRNPSFQLNDKWSLLTDSATYFLTVNNSGGNLRLQPVANNVSGNTLPAEPWFMYTTGKYFRNRINQGLYYVVGSDHLFSSSYDKGEGWTSPDIIRNGTLTENFSDLQVASNGPVSRLKVALTGNAYNARRYTASVNSDSVLGDLLPYMNESVKEATFQTSRISSGAASITIRNITDPCGASSCPNDRVVVHKIELTYPRLFHFGGAANFEFSLPASTTNSGNYLEISGVNHGGIAPVLYDLTNGKRYEGVISGTQVRVVLQPSATGRNLVLVSQATANINSIASLETRNFVNYNTATTLGDYLIITNALLFGSTPAANPVEEYRAYRASPIGGGYNAKIYLEDQLIDQFGFGIKKNPAGIRNFIMYARSKFAVAPKHVFIIGRGVHYPHQRANESSSNPTVRANLEKLNLVPTFGFPASDMLLAADLTTSKQLLPIGRLTAITPAEVAVYLKKVKDLETAQRTPSPALQDKAWMKQVAHIIGAGDGILDDILFQYMENYRMKVEDTLWGAKVTTFRKASTSSVEQLNDADLTRLINNGVSMITYYGHSSATTLEFNLDDPANYNNQGKYPMFLALGCNAGNTFDYNEGRFSARSYLSDKYVLAPERGSINFVASSHFGVVHYLDIWNSRAYTNMSTVQYGATIGEILQKTINDVYNFTTADDFFARANAEETILNGDPAVRLNQQAKPDYVISDAQVVVSPGIVSVADERFKVKVKAMNLGKAINQKVVVETKRELPDGTVKVLRRDTIRGIRYIDSTIVLDVSIDPITDKGTNKIIVTIDPENQVDELFETNNSVTKDVVVFEDEARPVYPNPYAIVNQSTITLKASTANPFSEQKQYRMEMDTTQLFNSPLKSVTTVTSKGGLIEFTPGITLRNGTVYYWRVAVASSNNIFNWNTSSFVYLANSEVGFNQSHYYQHLKSEGERLSLDSVTRTWVSSPIPNNLFIKNGVWSLATGQESDLIVSVNGSAYIRNTCSYGLIFNVFDKNTFKPWSNALVNGKGMYNSLPPNCGASRIYNFEFENDSSGRRKAMEFLRNVVPDGNYVVMRNQPRPNAAQNQYVSTWLNDAGSFNGANTLYSELKRNGVTVIDSFTRLRTFAAVYKKGSSQFQPSQIASAGEFDVLSLSVNCTSSDSLGLLTSAPFGPSKAWKQARWAGTADATDKTTINIIGVKSSGAVDTLQKNISAKLERYDISSINANEYPYLKLQMRNVDTVNFTPYQLQSWQLTHVPVPEGALSANLLFSMKDTVDVGEPLEFRIGFKNISSSAFSDSVRIKAIVTDRNNSQRVIPVQKIKAIGPDEMATIQLSIDTKQLVGMNTLFVDVNPDNDQLEQFRFNNFAFRNFFVRGDTLNPLIDVTFDNVHILNRDIVSAKPDIVIKLKDEAKWMLLNDTATATVQVRFPNGSLRTYRYNSDTLTFTPASSAPNTDNTATIRLRPYFSEDGDYELMVTGKDMSNNQAGTTSYRVGFQVINKAMISNMLNYPNPFTTSTAFVFTLTGSEVPQNIRIQILTVTGKVVREITKAELGTLRIGRNITDFKWDGTDQFGQKLANGVYLYRVITNQQGRSLEKYKGPEDETDKYFTKGYGKMYLMR